jgi:hypothetical protein
MPIVDLIEGMGLGSGVDIGGHIFGDPVVRTTAVSDTHGQATDIFLTLVESQEDQDSALNLSVEASAAFGLFGGSAKFNLSQQMHVHRFAITLVIRATVFNSFSQMRDVQLTNSASELLKNGQTDRFREEFGDMFVRGLRTGGEFCAVLQIVGHDEADQSAIKAEFRAGGILGAVAASTEDSFSNIVRKVTSGRETRLRHIQLGGVQTASLDPEQMAAHALSFAGGLNDTNSVAFAALIVPYTTIDLPTPPNFIDVQTAKDVLAILMQKRTDALSRLTAFNFVLGHPEQFVIPPTMDLNGIIGRFEIALSALSTAASRCVNKPLEAEAALVSVAKLDIPTDEFPTRNAGAPPPPPLPQLVLVPDLTGTHVGFEDSFALVNALNLGIHPRNGIHTDDNRRNEEIVNQDPLPTGKGGPLQVPIGTVIEVDFLSSAV